MPSTARGPFLNSLTRLVASIARSLTAGYVSDVLLASARGLGAPLRRRHLTDPLGEAPEMSLGILRVVPAVAVVLVGRLVDDLRAGGLRPVEVRVDVVGVHVHLRAGLPAPRPTDGLGAGNGDEGRG